MLGYRIYLYQLGLVLFALTSNSIELADQIHGKLCDKIDDGKFRGELIRCMKMMPLEVQIVWKSCGAKYFNRTKPACDYCEIINEMCANPMLALEKKSKIIINNLPDLGSSRMTVSDDGTDMNRRGMLCARSHCFNKQGMFEKSIFLLQHHSERRWKS
ncbi:hypothetical protein HNY73_013436 [Argiope bruennichi]|uniref:Uncharacterized protein n=1 Tax=Argiope bruennichi TaxID=94029 RepID=A0A8T0EY03_ARGBR|nr:hypothetical protein HNY73_013436 [Argiope bruennichi]